MYFFVDQIFVNMRNFLESFSLKTEIPNLCYWISKSAQRYFALMLLVQKCTDVFKYNVYQVNISI